MGLQFPASLLRPWLELLVVTPFSGEGAYGLDFDIICVLTQMPTSLFWCCQPVPIGNLEEFLSNVTTTNLARDIGCMTVGEDDSSKLNIILDDDKDSI